MTFQKKPGLRVVSNLSESFKKIMLTTEEEVQRVKGEHRARISTLVDDYMDKVQTGEAEGIRHAKDLMDIIKVDLLLLGEATDRTENKTQLEEARITNMSEVIDVNDENVQAVIEGMMKALNGANDNYRVGDDK